MAGNVDMRTGPRARTSVSVAILFVCFAATIPCRLGGAEPVATNMDLLVETAKAVVDEAVRNLEAGKVGLTADDPLLIEPKSEHDANWLVEHLLVEEMLGRGFEVTIDSSSTEGVDARLSYRIIDLGILGWSGLMGDHIKRECRISVNLQVSRFVDGEVLWQHEASERVGDRIPKKRLEVLQNSRYEFANTELEEQSWGKFVEPAIVSTLLGTLVYLFFSKR